jgi:hypothetical protein
MAKPCQLGSMHLEVKKRKKRKGQDELIESQKGAMNKFLSRNTTTSRNPDDLAIVAVEEQGNSNL